MKKTHYIIFVVILTSNVLWSCEKEIDVNLNKSHPRYVIEANLSTIVNQSEVRITQTVNFNEPNEYPAVQNAFVTITNTKTQVTDTLKEMHPGRYSKQNLQGLAGNSYRLEVKINNEFFVSNATIPYPFKLDSIKQMNLAGQTDPAGPPAGTPAAGTVIRLLPIYKNLSGEDKYFQFIISKNDTIINSIIPRSDLVSSPINLPFPIFVKAKKNDTLLIDMQFIDPNIYKYLSDLMTNLGQFSATPSNPTSNISNGALGYFKAHTTQRKMLIVQ